MLTFVNLLLFYCTTPQFFIRLTALTETTLSFSYSFNWSISLTIVSSDLKDPSGFSMSIILKEHRHHRSKWVCWWCFHFRSISLEDWGGCFPLWRVTFVVGLHGFQVSLLIKYYGEGGGYSAVTMALFLNYWSSNLLWEVHYF